VVSVAIRAYLGGFILLIALSGLWLLTTKAGLTPEAIAHYYGGSEARGGASLEGLAEILWRHVASVALVVIAGVHLLKSPPRWLFGLLSLLALGFYLTPFWAATGQMIAAWVKLISSLGLIGGLLYLGGKLLKER
jgi:hypothetical protein